MKPEILSITNIGPFIGKHTIDFTSLDSIFLVCGKTGAGKTTIFDAISYVFYSKPQGGRASIVRTLRSQFAADSEAAEAELVFTMGNSKYKIMRRLPFLRPGKKTETPEEVELSEWKDGEWSDLTSTNKSDTDKKILDIIKLREKEFSRIVLLPQGEFAEFLKAGSNEKKDTLAELFPVSRYTGIMKFAKEKEKEEGIKIKQLTAQLEALENEFDFNTYALRKKECEESIAVIKKNYTGINEKIKTNTARLEQAKLLTQKAAEYADVKTKLEDMELRTEEIEAVKKRIEKARRAAALSERAETVNKLMRTIEEHKTDIEKKIKEFYAIVNNLNLMEEEKSLIDEEKTKSEILKQNLNMLERASAVYSEIKTLRQESEAAAAEKRQAEAELKTAEDEALSLAEKTEALAPLAKQLEARKEERDKSVAALGYCRRLFEIAKNKKAAEDSYATHSAASEKNRAELEMLEKNIKIEEALLDDLKKEKEAAETNKASAVLASVLKENEPCPVCGSVHHPKPAVDEGRDIFSIQEKTEKCEYALKQFEKTKNGLTAAVIERTKDSEKYAGDIKEAERRFLLLNEEFRFSEFVTEKIPGLGEAEALIKSFAEKAEKDAAVLKEAQTASDAKSECENKLHTIQKKREEIKERLTNSVIAENGIKAALAEKQAAYDKTFSELYAGVEKGDIEDTMEHCRELLLNANRKINGYEERLSENKMKYARLETMISEKQDALKKSEVSLAEEESSLEAAVKEKGFSSIDELFSSVLPEEQILDFEDEISAFEEEKIALKQSAAGLQLELKDKTIEEPEMLEDAIAELEKKFDEENARLTWLTAELTRMTGLYERRTRLSEELNAAASEAESIKALSASLNGENRFKLKFDIWILSTFLKEITVYANTRLERMSSGRYVLRVSSAVSGNSLSGLDLEIYDAYTGGLRPAASLSGGETFMVSISLALGLADSIQAGNGGIRLDSMFIDEGFGSLDEASLENAIDILDEVRGNRMVGIISHVSELRTRIPQKIEIEKTPQGSRIVQS